MDCKANRIPYRQTQSFSAIALDYIDQLEKLRPFYKHPPTLQGIQKAIGERRKFNTDRQTLVTELKRQYAGIMTTDSVKKNIEALADQNTFTVTTAHQNNLFTGPLYFIYKIIHTIRLAEYLRESLPGNYFVPVFYVGTEDADLDELNHIYLGGEKLSWDTSQTGAVGRMKIDAALLQLIDRIEGELTVQPNGGEIVRLLRENYKKGEDIQTATFRFVNTLFSKYGLVVLLPDNAALKKQMHSIFEDDLLHQAASEIVEKTAGELESAGYKVQANPREINLFYLENERRERIIQNRSGYVTNDKLSTFTKDELLTELREKPENFSPNVILRGLYQETILPNVAFIGGAGETAYWLQLRELFEHYKVPFPVLVLRNSFMIVEKKSQERATKLGFTIDELFLPEMELINRLVMRESKNNVRLNGAMTELEELYNSFKKQASAVDTTLGKHVDALRTRTMEQLQELEKKMLRAEKRKFGDHQRQVHSLKEKLFPGNGLQERRDNLCYYYAKWGEDFIGCIYRSSLALEQEFVIITE